MNQLVKDRLRNLNSKTIARQNSFVEHLVCPEDSLQTEKKTPHLKSLGDQTSFVKYWGKCKNEVDLSPWDFSSNYDDYQILRSKVAFTSHGTSKIQPITQQQPLRAKTSYSTSRKTTAFTIPRPPSSSLRRESTPSQKARLGARCFLSAFSDSKVSKNSLDIALMNLMGEKKGKYVI